MANIKTSEQYKINWRDAGQSAMVAFVTTFVATSGQLIADWLSSPSLFAIDKVSLVLSLKAALAAGVADLGRRFFTASKIVITNASKETVQAIKEGEATVKVFSTQN